MPKRRMTAARILQIAAWQSAELIPRVKLLLLLVLRYLRGARLFQQVRKLYYFIVLILLTPIKLLKLEDGLVAAQHGIMGVDAHGFTMQGPSPRVGYYGKAVVSVKVPRKMVRIEHPYSSAFATVANKDLKGLPVKRLM